MCVSCLSYTRFSVLFLVVTFTFQPNLWEVLCTFGDLLDKPWSQVSSLLRPGTCLCFLSRKGFSIPTARRFSSNAVHTHALAHSAYHFFRQEQVPTSMHSVRLEPTKLILLGTRTTYSSTKPRGTYEDMALHCLLLILYYVVMLITAVLHIRDHAVSLWRSFVTT